MALLPASRMRSARARLFRSLGLGACTAFSLANTVSAETITVDLTGSYIHRIHSAGEVVPYTDLRMCVSRGEVLTGEFTTTIRSADSRNLESYFTRNGTSDAWLIAFDAPWTPGLGAAADFFFFEVGGNDVLEIRAVFASGEVGAPITVSDWTATDVTVEAGPNYGQRVHGVGARFEDLLRANGSAVSPNDRVIGLHVDADGVDGAAFLLRDPGVHEGVSGNGEATVTPSEPMALSPVTVTFEGPWASETDSSPNPFLDYRLKVRFDGPGGRSVEVPGYFDANGDRGDTGNLWRAKFLPPVSGTWTATASMRSGSEVAISLAQQPGAAVTSVDGHSVAFDVSSTRPTAKGFFRRGALLDSGKHHRKFEFGPYYLKAGTNGPENFLGLRCLDDITKSSGGGGTLHSFEPHIADWNPGDPIPGPFNANDDGRGVIGALNYLHEQGVNSLFTMVMNLGGDGRDVYPFLGPRNRRFEKTHYDTSRLRQWGVIFEHAQRKSISLSLVMNETEASNETWLDGGHLGTERKLFYRELVARFGHLPAIRWNICEENDFPPSRLDEFAAYIKAHDRDVHAVSIHNHPNDLSMFQSLLSSQNIDAASLQFSPNNANSHVEQVREWTAQSGRPWVVDADEQGPWHTGLTNQNAADTRKRILYDALFSGGGVEFYFGYHALPLGGDLSLEDFRTREEMWGYLRNARELIEGELPFHDMDPRDELVRSESGSFGGAEVFALPGRVYAVYYPRASDTGELDLEGHTQRFEVEWYDPRNGEFVGVPVSLGTGGDWKDMPSPPHTSGEDWIALVREGPALSSTTVSVTASAPEIQTVGIDAGESYAGRVYLMLSNFSGTGAGFMAGGMHVPLNFDRLTRLSASDPSGQIFQNQIGMLNGQGCAEVTVRFSPQWTSALVGMTVRHVAVTVDPFDWVSNVIEVELVP